MSLSKTYYTCDDCEWAGPFADARDHYDETGHESYSRRDEEPESEPEVEVPESLRPVPYMQPYAVPVPCNHMFAYWSVIPPTHCPLCGAQLRPYHQPWKYWQTPQVTWSTDITHNNQFTVPSDTGTVVINLPQKLLSQ